MFHDVKKSIKVNFKERYIKVFTIFFLFFILETDLYSKAIKNIYIHIRICKKNIKKCQLDEILLRTINSIIHTNED